MKWIKCGIREDGCDQKWVNIKKFLFIEIFKRNWDGVEQYFIDAHTRDQLVYLRRFKTFEEAESFVRQLLKKMNNEKTYKGALQAISRILENVKYERSGREYSLDQDEMSWMFYCRDLADRALLMCKEE